MSPVADPAMVENAKSTAERLPLDTTASDVLEFVNRRNRAQSQQLETEQGYTY